MDFIAAADNDGRAGDIGVITDVVLRLKRGERENIERVIRENAEKRAATQPSGRSAGSVFKAADGVPAGLLIDGAGLKGTRIGGAYVSRRHANFILNDGAAAFRDVTELIELIRKKVYNVYGVKLEPEIRIIWNE